MVSIAKPFLKWAGGKSQLISQIQNNLPQDLLTTEYTYIEPFVGSGAILFWILQNYPKINKIVINDINEELINVYKTILNDPQSIINILKQYQNEYHKLTNDSERKEYYYNKRSQFNTKIESTLIQSALFIFLNKNCFNGLYRVNKNGQFNVPIGNYKTPTICDEENLLACSKILQNTTILCGDYQDTLKYVTGNSIFYFDPPYKPISKTSNFNSYSKDTFGDTEQDRLKTFCDLLSKQNLKWILSNSDTGDNFFDNLYSQYKINRVKAKRSINSKGDSRGEINELLIKNF